MGAEGKERLAQAGWRVLGGGAGPAVLGVWVCGPGVHGAAGLAGDSVRALQNSLP